MCKKEKKKKKGGLLFFWSNLFGQCYVAVQLVKGGNHRLDLEYDSFTSIFVLGLLIAQRNIWFGLREAKETFGSGCAKGCLRSVSHV